MTTKQSQTVKQGRKRGGGLSLAKLLAEHRGKRNRKALPPFTIEQILAWAGAHHGRTGQWPNRGSGLVTDAPGETWVAVEVALQQGRRGLPCGTSLAKLLAQHRHVRNRTGLPQLTIRQILAWADEHHERAGQWPQNDSGAIPGSGGETWSAVGQALTFGLRGLPRGSSLARLLDQRRGTKRSKYHSPLAVGDILAWADAYHGRHGRWPSVSSGAVPEGPHETWNGLSMALRTGSRGLPAGSSLAKLLIERRSARSRYYASRLSTHQILVWADAHHLQTGRWPSSLSGAVTGAAGETWMAVDLALRQGLRGLPGGSSLAKLLDQHRRKPAGHVRKPR